MRDINIKEEIEKWFKNGVDVEEDEEDHLWTIFRVEDKWDSDGQFNLGRFVEFYALEEHGDKEYSIDLVWDSEDGKARWEYSQELTEAEYREIFAFATDMAKKVGGMK